MNYMKRAILSVTRRKSKSLILLILIFVLGNVIAGAIAIQQATANAEKNIKQSMGSVSMVEMDYEKFFEKNSGTDAVPPKIDKETIEKIGGLSMVKQYDYSENATLYSSELKRYTDESASGNGNTSVMITGGSSEGERLTLRGVQYAPLLDIEQKKTELVSGRTFTEEEIKNGSNSVIIPQKFAEKNNLQVGSTFVLKNHVIDYSKAGTSITPDTKLDTLETQDVTVEVVGIVKPVQKIEQKTGENKAPADQFSFLDEEKENTFYAPNKMINDINTFTDETLKKHNPAIDESMLTTGYYTPIFILDSPESIEAFREAAAAILPEFYKVSASSDSFDKVAGSLKTMQSLATFTLYVAVGASLIILSLLITLFLRDRKHELGIYLSLGEKRLKVITQIVIEVVAIAFVGITLSLLTGNLIANSVSETMIQNQASETSNGNQAMISQMDMYGYSDNVSKDDVMSQYKVELNGTYIGLFYLIGLGTVIVSTVIPIIYIVRMNPKKIML